MCILLWIFGFKLLFGSAENKEFLISFLNSLLGRDDEIVDITYKNSEMFGMSAADRKAVYDFTGLGTELFLMRFFNRHSTIHKD